MEIINSISNLDFVHPKSDTIYQESLMALIVAKNDPPAMMLAKLAATYVSRTSIGRCISFGFHLRIAY